MKENKHVVLAILFLVMLIPLGFYTKIYSGICYQWVNNKLGGIFYEIFWCLIFFILIPKAKPFSIALWVFIFTCILEFVQLLNSEFLDVIRSNFIGQTIIGNSFAWNDFPYYFIGAIIGYLVLQLLEKKKL